ncbi:CPBP family intramembrane metalloprotease [Microbacterium foliorum]|uniref:CAAX amino terminal protease self-immunity n=1 Tax=Microbacterium foliorum TaxID=104336 RepID=A0A0F0L108_9MICO|nr:MULTISPECIES: type II CAAX endopeptidase family protein [Microbacterium]AXL10876.1 CPBP family intramembrane metalloprotease [Microbacterium foliorum]KAA0961873.1 CPBP family intramembrane metalloprotease [Microbacterium sp. ANT_H45B]KJL26065.1 CAAX amino terminal protease self- immunity [Microbacterium foliorum]KQZ23665.1 hypothetical protein ASD43_04285 [Microbacterium sp. Root553]MCP1428514.1 membrane protease YdiL (CAAX protease family) [Microbacterium foliorum]
MRSQVGGRSLILFLLVSFVGAWVIALPLYFTGGLASPLAPFLIVGVMFAPALGVLAAWGAQKPRPGERWRALGVTSPRPVSRPIWFSVLGLFLGSAIVIAGVFLAAALGLIELDLVEFSGYVESVRALGVSDLAIPGAVVVLMQLAAIPVNAVVSAPFAFAEEVGWRGWLLPRLLPLGVWPALVLSGAIWGLWHAPLILLGYNFGRPDLLGLGMMVLACVLFGIILGWLRLRSTSIWPAVIAHSAFNATASFATLVAAAGQQVDLLAISPLGWVTCLIMIAVIGVLVLTKRLRKENLTAQNPHDRLEERQDLSEVRDDASRTGGHT